MGEGETGLGPELEKLSETKMMIDRRQLGDREGDRERDKERGTWTNPCDFFISCLGYAVGLGNIWRFPYMCFKHGGGSFLIPYFLMLFLAGLPVFLLEISLGQYAGVGPIKIFGHMAPIARGLGFAVVSVGLFLAFYYNVLVSWAIWYLLSSLASRLEWVHCGHWYNSPSCWSEEDSLACSQQETEQWEGGGGYYYYNNTCLHLQEVCQEFGLEGGQAGQCRGGEGGEGEVRLESLYNRTTAPAEYYERFVLGNRGHDWYNFGSVRLDGLACLAAAWLLVAVCLIRGIKTSGKVAYFTSLFPYLVLIILAGRGLSLPGAGRGVAYYLSPDWTRLQHTQVWVEAATQVIFSLGPGN